MPRRPAFTTAASNTNSAPAAGAEDASDASFASPLARRSAASASASSVARAAAGRRVGWRRGVRAPASRARAAPLPLARLEVREEPVEGDTRAADASDNDEAVSARVVSARAFRRRVPVRARRVGRAAFAFAFPAAFSRRSPTNASVSAGDGGTALERAEVPSSRPSPRAARGKRGAPRTARERSRRRRFRDSRPRRARAQTRRADSAALAASSGRHLKSRRRGRTPPTASTEPKPVEGRSKPRRAPRRPSAASRRSRVQRCRVNAAPNASANFS